MDLRQAVEEKIALDALGIARAKRLAEKEAADAVRENTRAKAATDAKVVADAKAAAVIKAAKDEQAALALKIKKHERIRDSKAHPLHLFV